MSLITAAAILASETTTQHEGGHVSPYVFGGIALGTLLLLLFMVTRFNPDR